MDTVVLDGVEYVKASVVAQKFNYTADYMGQLCRAKKVDARLVGRTWFVNPDSVMAHKHNTYKNSAPAEVKVPINKDPEATVRKRVPPVVKNKTAKSLGDFTVTSKLQKRNLTVSYELDDEALMPTLTRKHTKPPRLIRVEPAEAKKVSVAGIKKSVSSFEPSKLPEVSLSGRIKVAPLPTAGDELDEDPQVPPDGNYNKKNIDISTKQEVKVRVKKFSSIKKRTPNTPALKGKNHLLTTPEQKGVNGGKGVVSAKFSPQSVQRGNQARVSWIQTLVRVSPLIATLLALISVLLMLSMSARVVVLESGYTSQFVFKLTNFLDFFIAAN